MPGTKVKKQKSEGNRAAIYARVSDKSQDGEDKTSIAEQTGDMEAYCEQRGLNIVARYQEVGQGWSKKRSQFQKLLNDAKRGRFDVIVCWKSDRLSRGMFPAAALMEVIEASHVKLEAVMDSIDMKTFGLMAAIGKLELDSFRERASMGKRGAAKAGRIPVSNVPYGYRVGDDGRPEIVEDEAEVVRRIYRWCVEEGLGATVIRNRLTAEDVPLGRTGKRWWDGQIHRILTNETYKGTWWYGRARYISTEDGIKVYDQDPENWIAVPFPPIIDAETWDRCQEMRTKRRNYSGRNTKIFYLLQHLVRCTECGMLMGCMATRKRTVKHGDKVYKYELEVPRRYYKCYGVQHFQTGCREHTMIRAERLEDLVWTEVKNVLANPALIVAGIESLGEKAEEDGLSEEIRDAEKELEKVQIEEDRAIRLYVSGKITEAQLDHQRKFITERLESARRKLDDCQTRESAQAGQMELAERVMEWAELMGDGLDDLPQEKRREVLRLLLDEVTINRENHLTFTLAIPTEDLESIAPPVSNSPSRTRPRTL
ncbi:MAG: recombinase family protein [Chloroflexota bacterium]|nr:recombinase family protein [Chloroflexota bacterium]